MSIEPIDERSVWAPLPRPGCAGVASRVLLREAGLAAVQLRFDAGATIDAHVAPHDIEVICLSGAGFASVGGHRITLAEGQRVQWPAGVLHCLFTEQEEMTTLMLERVGGEHPSPACEGELIDPLIFGTRHSCFGCGPMNQVGMRLRFYRQGEEVVTRLAAREGWEGPPGVLHGGLQATLADELGAWTLVGLRERFGFTTSMQLRYLRPARIDAPVEGRGRLVEDSERGGRVQVSLRQGETKLLTGSVSYLYPTVELAEKLLGFTLPESWRRLARPSS